jgi:hypothetical protein
MNVSQLNEHPAMRRHQREALQDRMFPDWTADAICRGDRRPNVMGRTGGFPAGVTWKTAFLDDTGYHADLDDYATGTTLDAMALCAQCPVRRECAEYAYEVEMVPIDRWWTSELIESDLRFGVFGGLPGGVRERLASHPERINLGELWFLHIAVKHRWVEDLDDERNIGA